MKLVQTLKDAWQFITLTSTAEEIEVLFGRTSLSTTRTYRLPSVKEALGVPAIHRAVALISSTVGTLTLVGYRNGVQMTDQPRLFSRPDPNRTPQQFYSTAAANMAKYGEIVWWIANRDGDGLASALVNVPLTELSVRENPANRLRPIVQWGTITSSWYSPANSTGQFVHITYPLTEPLALRGSGPLQLCNAASSVAVEAQAWAAQFYAEGGNPSTIIKYAGILGGTDDADGDNEADKLRAQWVNRPHNVPRVIDDRIEDVKYTTPNSAAAQMLDARQFQNGDAAREFGIPGSLLEYQQPGASLTYQNLEGEFTKLIRVCLQPLYLEPVEQAMSDLVTRSTTGRFNVDGFLRADIKTRYDVHKLAIDSNIYDPAYARRVEGIDPGDIEFQPVPFAPPAAEVRTIPRAASAELREVRCPRCQRLIVRAAGAVEGKCTHCKQLVAA